MMPTCPEPGVLVEEEIDRVLTQYRESPHLLGVIRSALGQVEDAYLALCELPSFFDLNTAVGDQLTLLGKRLGFPRCHCVCTIPPVFGFDCGNSYGGPYTIVGFCDETGTWKDCRETGTADVCIDNDEAYRRILKARRYQMLGMYDYASLLSAAQALWGANASVSTLGGGRVVVAPGRALTAYETMIRQIAFRALPIAPGITVLTSDADGPVFGFGTGWAGFCGPDRPPRYMLKTTAGAELLLGDLDGTAFDFSAFDAPTYAIGTSA